MSLQTRHVRLATFGKINDRFLTVQFQVHPKGEATNEMGRLYFVVEIKNPWFSASQIGQSIVNVFTREYFKGDETSDFLNFENAVKKVNEVLAQITQSGETDWIGNLNAAVALVNNKELNLTATGDIHIFLWRDNQLSPIVASDKGGEVHPLKTFGDIVAGTLEKNDRLFFANSELPHYFNSDKIKQSLSNLPLYEAAEELAKDLKKQRVKHLNALLLEVKDEEGLAEIAIENESEVIYLDQATSAPSFKLILKFSKEKIKPVLVAFSLNTWINLKKFAKFNREKVFPRVKKISVNSYQKSAPVFGSLGKAINKQSQKLVDKSPALKNLMNKKAVLIDDVGEGLDKIGLNVSHYALHPQRSGSRALNNFKTYLVSFWAGVKNFFRFLFHPKNRALLYICLAVILVGIIVLMGVSRKGKNSQKEDVKTGEQTLYKAREENASAESALKSSDFERAKTFLHEAVADALIAQKTPTWRDEAEKILNEAETNLDKLTGTKRLKSDDPVATFSGGVNEIFQNGGTIYGIDPKSGQISESSLISRQAQKTAKANDSTLPIAGSVLLPESKTLLLFGAKSADEYNLTTKKIETPKTTFGNAWENSVAANLYANTIYLLDPNQNQIWKHAKSGENWDKGVAYNARRIDIKKGVSMAIDGFVWILKDNGEITKISKSERQDFKLTGLPAPIDKITKPVKIATDADTNLAWILDAGENRIIEFDKTNGKFTQQFGLPNTLLNAIDFIVNPKSQQIWVLVDNKVFEFSMI